MSQKKQRTRKKNKAQPLAMKPPLSAQAEADSYLAEEEQGTYDAFWDNLGYFLDHGADFPPSLSLDRERARCPNNRAPG